MSLFGDEYQALTFAYRAADRSIVKLSSAFTANMGSTVRSPSEMTPQDWIAQAGMIIGRVRAELTGNDLMLVEAKFSSPSTADGLRTKIELIPVMVPRLLAERKKRMDIWYMADVIRAWTGVRRHHKDEWWAAHLKKSPETVRRWRVSEEPKNLGLETQLNTYLHSVVLKLNGPFFLAGWIP